MRCPYCAEEIQDAAVLCRFCGARKQDQEWQAPAQLAPPPAALPGPPKGYLTIKTAALLFAFSALFDLLSLSEPVPLFGALRGGAVATVYHLLYVAMLLGLGVGLWQGTRWGYRLVFASTAFYTLDKALFALDHAAQKALLESAGASQLRELGVGDMQELMIQVLLLTSLGLVVSWWLFALYVRFRRDYFHRQPAPQVEREAA